MEYTYRNDHTKDYILSVFNEILKKYPMSKITVAQIVEKAGISRSTFYRNYIDKYDIMNYTYKKLIDSNIHSIDNLVPGWD
ncbi:TetR/AcrR family transcriptional regulator [Clostridium estertheticum]|uniref:TetR/AcrR family transcriptional regulator n=1 Tax=Clostridium estertheticum TaxID=238834 RepID=UPI001CF325AF|nr:TetR/AcrR family transcriptional regulator [Clostridium estertheticum]MCB2353020.1 TetR/AcrR family transcriptional regulator [Clostridium estertheticum]WAG40317.1 TetR/AcrR family transcriptional regulator [Clostridium estertheticum]